MPQRGACGSWPVLPRQDACPWRDETLCSTTLAATRPVAAAFVLFFLLALRSQCGGSGCQGCGAQRSTTEAERQEPGPDARATRALHCAVLEGGRTTPQQPAAAARLPGSWRANVPPGSGRHPGVSREDWPAGAAAHSPTVKDRSTYRQERSERQSPLARGMGGHRKQPHGQSAAAPVPTAVPPRGAERRGKAQRPFERVAEPPGGRNSAWQPSGARGQSGGDAVSAAALTGPRAAAQTGVPLGVVEERVQGGAPRLRRDRAPLRLAPEEAVPPQPVTVAPVGPFIARPAPHLLRHTRTGNHGRHVEAHGAHQAQLHLLSGPGLDVRALWQYIASLPRREGRQQRARGRLRSPVRGGSLAAAGLNCHTDRSADRCTDRLTV